MITIFFVWAGLSALELAQLAWIIVIFVGYCVAVTFAWIAAYADWEPRFPKGHIREYDPDGIYTYADQNPRFR